MSQKGVTYLRRSAVLRKAVDALIQTRLADGTLEALQVASGEIFFASAGFFDVRLPRIADRISILSPFDNAVIQRERLSTIFGFEYQIECYLPQGRRRYGYFSLPLLLGDQFVGRMDCKAHRKTRQLEIRVLHAECDKDREARFVAAFAEAIEAFREFQNCDNVSLTRVVPRRLAAPLRRKIG